MKASLIDALLEFNGPCFDNHRLRGEGEVFGTTFLFNFDGDWNSKGILCLCVIMNTGPWYKT